MKTMRTRLAFTPFLFSALALGAMGAGQQQQSSAQSQSADSQSSASQAAAQNPATAQTASAANAGTASAAIPSYPDSPKGLEELMKKMLELKKKGDDKDLAPYVESLKLPAPDAFFRATFGEEVGSQTAQIYQQNLPEQLLVFPNTLDELLKQHKDRPKAIRFTDSCDPNATETEYPILLLRTNSQPLYDVRFYRGRSMSFIPYFAYVHGSFRYVGNLEAPKTWDHLPSSPIPLIHVEGNAQKRKRRHNVTPRYPQEALQRRIQGIVTLRALIGEDGAVQALSVISGQCWFAEASLKAVRQWHYEPTMVNGKLVRVDTTIEVTFSIVE